jgi:O-antigen ligase
LYVPSVRVELVSLPRQAGLVPALLGAAAVAVPASRQGAYFPPAWGWSAFGLVLAAALALAFRARIEVSALQWALSAGIGSVLLWTALSTAWSDSIPRTVDEVERTLVYVAAIGAVIFVVSAETVAYLLGGVVVAVVGVSTYALLHQPSGHDALNPLSGPLGYWNALGILDTLALLLALGFVLSPRLPRAARIGAAVVLPVLAVTLYLTHSRGSMAALGAGLLLFALCHPWLSGRRRRLAASVLAAVAVAAIVTAVALTGGASQLVGKTYAAFRSPPAPRGQPSQRILTLSGSFRPKYWRVAWREYRAHPWLGSGAGTFDLYWDRYRHTQYGSRDAHNLYLETLAETGPVGLFLLVVTLLLPFAAFRSNRRDPVLAAAAGAYLAFLLHAAVDWDWEMPAVTIAGLLCGAALTLAAPGRRSLAPRIRWVALAVLAVLGTFAAVTWRGNQAAAASTDDAAHGRYPAALAEAHTAARLMPWDSEPWTLLGVVQLAVGDRRAARTDLRKAVAKDPRDWYPWYELARASTGGARRAALARATSLNPIGIREVPSLK